MTRHASTNAMSLLPAMVALLAAGGSTFGQCLEEQKLASPDGTPGDRFAFCLALEAETACIGAPQADPVPSVHLYRHTTEGWTPTGKLSPSAGGRPERYGHSVAIDGDVILVGNPVVPDGNAYIHRFDGSAWIEEQILIDPTAERRAQFGVAVAIDGDVAVVGAFFNQPSGAATVFRFDGVSWIREQTLVGSNAESGDYFGAAVAVRGDRILVGAPEARPEGSARGVVYAFHNDGSQWIEEAALFPPEESHAFGFCLAMDDATAIVGAPEDDATALDAGAAYVLQHDGVRWSITQTLLDRSGIAGAKLGTSVALDGDQAVVTAAEIEFFADAPGKALAFQFDGSSWISRGEMIGSDVGLDDHFGSAVALSDGRVLIGADHNNLFVQDPGAAYAYTFPAFTLEVAPSTVVSGETVSFTVRRGTDDDRVVLFLCALDDVPFSQHLQSGRFDANWEWSSSAIVPPGLSGHALTFVAYGIDACGGVRATGVEPLVIE